MKKPLQILNGMIRHFRIRPEELFTESRELAWTMLLIRSPLRNIVYKYSGGV